MQVRKHVSSDLPNEVITWLNNRTLLGSTDFTALWEKLGGKSVYWICYDADQCVGLLPSVQFGRGRLARLQAMPDGLYARIHLNETECDRQQITRMILTAITESGYARVYVNDYYRQFADHAGFDAQEGRTSRVEIGTEEWRPPDKKLQSEIRKAQREEVVAREFSLETDFDRFVDLMQHTEKRHGREQKYPPKFYHALARLAKQDTRVRWLVCECDRQLAASHIYLVEDDQLLHWQAFFNKEYSRLKPNQAIMFAVVSEMNSQGVRVLNLGASPENAATLTDYKEKWGGEIYSYPCLVRKSWLGRLL
jgi:hypothetical protein